MQPANSVELLANSAEFQQLNFFTKTMSDNKYRLMRGFELKNTKKLESFKQLHARQHIVTLYTALDSSSPQFKELLNSSFDPFPMTKYQVFQTSPMAKYVLECQVALGQPLTLESVQSLPPPAGFDSYAIVQPGTFQLSGNQLLTNQQEQTQYEIFAREQIMPRRFLCLDQNKVEQKQEYCDICRHCAEQKISHQAYFNTQLITPNMQFEPKINEPVVFCVNDNIKLCAFCDQMLHSTPVLQLHKRIPVNQNRRIETCEFHHMPKKYYDRNQRKWYCTQCMQGVQGDFEDAEEALSRIDGDLTDFSFVSCQEKLCSKVKEVQDDVKQLEDDLVSSFKHNLEQLQKVGQYSIQQILSQLLQVNHSNNQLKQMQLAMKDGKITLNEQYELFQEYRQFVGENTAFYANFNAFIDSFLAGISDKFDAFLSSFRDQIRIQSSEIQELAAQPMRQRLYGIYGNLPSKNWIDVALENQEQFDLGMYKDFNLQEYKNPIANYLREQNQQLQDTLNVTNFVGQEVTMPHLFKQLPAYSWLSKRQNELIEEEKARTAVTSESKGKTTNRKSAQPFGAENGTEPPTEQLSAQAVEQQFSDSMGVARTAAQTKPATLRSQNLNFKTPDLGHDTNYLDQLFDEHVKVDIAPSVASQIDQQNKYQMSASLANQQQFQAVTMQPYPDVSRTATSPDMQQSSIYKFAPVTQQAVPISPLVQNNLQAAENINLPQKDFLEKYKFVDKTYRFSEQNIRLKYVPFPEVAEFDDNLPIELFLVVCHYLKLQHSFSKLKIIQPEQQSIEALPTFSRVFTLAENHAFVLILHLSNASVLKKMALLCAGKLHQGDNVARGNLAIDLSERKYDEGQCFTFTTRWIQLGDIHIQKNFSAVSIRQTSWNCDSVGLYLFKF